MIQGSTTRLVETTEPDRNIVRLSREVQDLRFYVDCLNNRIAWLEDVVVGQQEAQRAYLESMPPYVPFRRKD